MYEFTNQVIVRGQCVYSCVEGDISELLPQHVTTPFFHFISSGGRDTTIHKTACKQHIGIKNIYHAFVVFNSFLTLSLAEQLAELV